MIDDDTLLKEFNDLIETNKDKCCFCLEPLTDDNISEYKSFFKIDGKPVLASQCVFCQEVLDRIYNLTLKKIITTEEQIRADIKNEGWTVETLKAHQEKKYNTIN